MPDLILTIGQLRITPLFWCLSVAFVFSSFSMWRFLTAEDYKEQDIFTANILMVLAGVTFGMLTDALVGKPVIGAIFGVFLISVWRFRILGENVWEGLDSLSLSWLFFLFFGGIGLYLTGGNIFYFGYSLIGTAGFVIYPVIKKSYRRFSWYKSGKTGFMFWAISFFCFFFLLVLDFWLNSGLYLTKVFWLAGLLSSIGAIYYRSKKI